MCIGVETEDPSRTKFTDKQRCVKCEGGRTAAAVCTTGKLCGDLKSEQGQNSEGQHLNLSNGGGEGIVIDQSENFSTDMGCKRQDFRENGNHME